MGEEAIGDLIVQRYRLDELLGAGGFARVYRATDVTTNRVVAIKLLFADDPRFQRELAALTALNSPHTVQLLDSGSTELGRPFLVSEFIDGRDLRRVLRDEGRLPANVVVHILEQLCDSLVEAHQAGVLHRDIKPENVLVYADDFDPWCVKLVDFGLARPTHGAQELTQAGELVGTPRYMSPEQLTERTLTPRSDIYSLGIVAFEMLMGSGALTGNAWADQLDRLASGYHLVASEESTPTELRGLILHMTARDPRQRPPSAASVRAALGRGAAPTETRVAARRMRQRVKPWTVGLGLAVLAGAIAALMQSRPATPPRVERTPPPAVATTGDVGPKPAPKPLSEPIVAITPKHVSGCGRQPLFSGRGQLRVENTFDGEGWLTYVPKNYDNRQHYPLIVFLHQGSEPPKTLFGVTDIEQLAERHQFVIVAPDDGPIGNWKEHENGIRAIARAKRDYVSEIEAVYEETAMQLCIDRSRVLVLGHGHGGRLALELACEPWVSAIALNSYRKHHLGLVCDRAIPTMMISPLNSERDPVAGGRNCSDSHRIPLADMEHLFQQRNGCAGRPAEPSTREHGRCESWECTIAPFVACRVNGGSGWPGAPPRPHAECDGVPTKFAVGETIFDFFDEAPALTDAQVQAIFELPTRADDD